MIEILSIFFLQVFFQLVKVLSIRHTANQNMFWTLTLTLILQGLWLITSALGIKAVFESNWHAIISYIIGGVLGAYLAMKITIRKNR